MIDREESPDLSRSPGEWNHIIYGQRSNVQMQRVRILRQCEDPLHRELQGLGSHMQRLTKKIVVNGASKGS